MKYYAQGNQDIWVLDLFKDYKNKTYVDVGAMDGITYSNSAFFEYERKPIV